MSHPNYQEFFRRCWDRARDGMDIGGDDVQEWGEALGILRCVRVSAPCGEACNCDELTGGDFPTECYRPEYERNFPDERAASSERGSSTT